MSFPRAISRQIAYLNSKRRFTVIRHLVWLESMFSETTTNNRRQFGLDGFASRYNVNDCVNRMLAKVK